jgi:hypothetical protein
MLALKPNPIRADACMAHAVRRHIKEHDMLDVLETLATVLESTRTDSLGRGIVIYWPNIPFEGIADPVYIWS